MDNNKDKTSREGVISVFLTLILLLVLALVLVSIEGARVSILRSFVDRALFVAMDSALAEFHGPLLEDYHIFGLDITYGTEMEDDSYLESKLGDYIHYVFDEKENLPIYGARPLNLLEVLTEPIVIADKIRLTDYRGNLFVNQALEYMNYSVISDSIGVILESMSMASKPMKISEVYEKKQIVEEELVGIDQAILKLMELLDGIKTKNSGLDFRKDGSLIIKDDFIKVFCQVVPTKESVAINNDAVFAVLEKAYRNPQEALEQIESYLLRLEYLNDTEESLYKEYNILKEKIDEAKEKLEILDGEEKEAKAKTEEKEKTNEKVKSDEKTKKDENEVIHIEETKKEVLEEIKQLEKSITENNEKKDNCIREKVEYINKVNDENISQEIAKIIPLINKAIVIFDHIIKKSNTFDGLIEDYSKTLYQEKENMGDLFANLEEELLQIKKYSQEDYGSGYNFYRMKEILENNLLVLGRVTSDLEEAKKDLSNQYFNGAKAKIESAKAEFHHYEIKELSIDYSGIYLDKNEVKDPLDSVKLLLENQILDLVMDTNELSDLEISGGLLPSNLLRGNDTKPDRIDVSTKFKNLSYSKNSGMTDMFKEFGQGEFVSHINTASDAVIDHLLLMGYLSKHFDSYSDKEKDGGKATSLLYEVEYILFNQLNDKENIYDATSKIISMRTILNFISLLGDSKRVNEARIAATALVGFTGLTVLVSITKTLILIIWSLVEALIDTSALLLGKKIPLLKPSNEIVTNFLDLFIVNKSFIKEKAKEIKEMGGMLSYENYLQLFLLLKKKEDLAYPMMDLIQENIKIRYDGNFLMNQCLYGFKADLETNIMPRFVNFGFVNDYISRGDYDFLYHYKTTMSYSY